MADSWFYEYDEEEYWKRETIEELEQIKQCAESVLKYLHEEEGPYSITSRWEDKDGDGFGGDIGYLIEGLEDFAREYIPEKIKKLQAEIDGGWNE